MQPLIVVPYSSDVEFERRLQTIVAREIQNALSTHLNGDKIENSIFISRAEAAKLLGGVSEMTISNWSKQGKINGKKIGNRLLFRRDEILEAIGNLK